MVFPVNHSSFENEISSTAILGKIASYESKNYIEQTEMLYNDKMYDQVTPRLESLLFNAQADDQDFFVGARNIVKQMKFPSRLKLLEMLVHVLFV